MHPKTKLKIIYRNKKISNINKVKFTMPAINSKITMHSKHQENLTHYKEKNESKPINETDLEMTQMIELAVKNIKIIIIGLFFIISKTQGETWKIK